MTYGNDYEEAYDWAMKELEPLSCERSRIIGMLDDGLDEDDEELTPEHRAELEAELEDIILEMENLCETVHITLFDYDFDRRY